MLLGLYFVWLCIQYLFAADENDNNEVVVRVLQLLVVLVKFGYYDDPKDVKDLLLIIYVVLNGKKNDYPSKDVKQIISAQSGCKTDCVHFFFQYTSKGKLCHCTCSAKKRSRRASRHRK